MREPYTVTPFALQYTALHRTNMIMLRRSSSTTNRAPLGATSFEHARDPWRDPWQQREA